MALKTISKEPKVNALQIMTVAQNSKFLGTLGRDLDRMFLEKVCVTWVSPRKSSGDGGRAV